MGQTIRSIDQTRKARESARKAKCEKKGLDYEQLMEMFLEELCTLNPEWQARKEQVRCFGNLIVNVGTNSDKTGA